MQSLLMSYRTRRMRRKNKKAREKALRKMARQPDSTIVKINGSRVVVSNMKDNDQSSRLDDELNAALERDE